MGWPYLSAGLLSEMGRLPVLSAGCTADELEAEAEEQQREASKNTNVYSILLKYTNIKFTKIFTANQM